MRKHNKYAPSFPTSRVTVFETLKVVYIVVLYQTVEEGKGRRNANRIILSLSFFTMAKSI